MPNVILSNASRIIIGVAKADSEEKKLESSYKELSKKYEGFSSPRAQILLGKEEFKDEKNQMIVGAVHLELSSGYEASVARFRIYNAYDSQSAKFRYADIKKQVVLGQSLTVCLGYADELEPVFVGFIAGIDFIYENGDLPYIEVSGMDVKGIMMANRYSEQLTSTSYSDAVNEILKRAAYQNLKTAGGYLGAEVTRTPDKTTPDENAGIAAQPGGDAASIAGISKSAAGAAGKLKWVSGTVGGKLPTEVKIPKIPGAAGGIDAAGGAATMEMVSESDYEFIVKAAKKFNFEFFVDRGTIYFRKAKSNSEPLLRLGIGAGIKSFNIGYSITGLVESVEARTIDAGTGKIVTSAPQTNPGPAGMIAAGAKMPGLSSVAGAVKAQAVSAASNLASGVASGAASLLKTGESPENLMDPKAKQLISSSKKVYVDPSIRSLEEAKARADSLTETMDYRLGSLECECIGIPELLPGRFLDIAELGAPAENRFYVTNVIHSFTTEHGYQTKIKGKAKEVQKVGKIAEEGKS